MQLVFSYPVQNWYVFFSKSPYSKQKFDYLKKFRKSKINRDKNNRQRLKHVKILIYFVLKFLVFSL